jgi:uncharacterized protein YdeI (YjbR/CyaY-like superfamily)
VQDLPPDQVLAGYIRQAAGLITSGERTRSVVRPAKKGGTSAWEVPAELAAALEKNQAAAKVFAKFSPSCQREYTEWIVEAKRAETKARRVAQAVEWMAEGKPRNWMYQNC